MKNGRGSSSNTLQYECKHKEILCHAMRYAGDVHWYVRKRVWSVLDEPQMKHGCGSLEYSTFSATACNHTVN